MGEQVQKPVEDAKEFTPIKEVEVAKVEAEIKEALRDEKVLGKQLPENIEKLVSFMEETKDAKWMTAWSGSTPWHGLGTQTEGLMTSYEALDVYMCEGIYEELYIDDEWEEWCHDKGLVEWDDENEQYKIVGDE